MTEDEAKKKACFQATGFAASEGTANEYGRETRNGLPTAMCIGSACMAWREKPPLWEHQSPVGPYTNTKETDGYGQKGRALPIEGFCGLAGAPQ